MLYNQKNPSIMILEAVFTPKILYLRAIGLTKNARAKISLLR
jgi:hypothetical protein